jgi:acyl transferase domain-containing protein
MHSRFHDTNPEKSGCIKNARGGFIKGVLTAHYGIVPPNLHFNEPNPSIPWEHYRLDVPVRPTPLKQGNSPLTVGVNSFGAGGANAHVVLQNLADAASDIKSPNTTWALPVGPILYMLSAANRDALKSLAIQHADFRASSPHRLEDIAYSVVTRRSHYARLLAVAGESAKDIEDRLRRFADGEVDSTSLAMKVTRRKKPQLAFVFSGQGGQWICMGLQQMRVEPVFREWMEKIDECFFCKSPGGRSWRRFARTKVSLE